MPEYYRETMLDKYVQEGGVLSKLKADISRIKKDIEFAKTHYDSQDEAATEWSNDIMPTSASEDLEYTGAIYIETTTLGDGTSLVGYDYSNAVKGTIDESWPFKAEIPSAAIVTAYIHTHGAQSYKPDGTAYGHSVFSGGDEKFVTTHNIPLYLAYQTTTLEGAYATLKYMTRSKSVSTISTLIAS